MDDTVHVTEASRSPSDLIDINIERLHSRTYLLREDKSISIVELKEKIASLTGVMSGLQHLIFRGRVLKDDKFLSDYHVEAGHTLYLVVRPPIPRLSQTSDPILSPVDSQRRVIPDALTAISLYLRRNGNEQDSGPSRENRIPTPSFLPGALQTRRQLLVGEVAECLSNISMLLVDHVNLRDPSSRRLQQGRAVGSEILLSILGNSLIELGRATSRIVNGERPVAFVARRQLAIPLGAGNLPLATAQRNAVITRRLTFGYVWPSPSSQQQVPLGSSGSQNAVNTEEELEDSGSEDEVVKRVTSSESLDNYSKEMVGVLSLDSETLFLGCGDAERVKLVVARRQLESCKEKTFTLGFETKFF